MAQWRKVLVSGSDARLNTLGVGNNISAPSAQGTISASGKIFASASIPSTGLGTFNVLTRLSTGEFAITGSTAITPTLNALTLGSGLTGGTFNGSSAVVAAVDSASLAGNGLGTGTEQIDVGAGNNITVSSTQVHVDSGSLVDTNKGLSAASSDISGLQAGSIGVKLGSGLAFNGTGQISASFVAGDALSAGNNITLAGGYNGTSAKSVAVDVTALAGTGLENDSNTLRVSGSNNLTGGKIVKWTGAAFADSLVAENGSQLDLGSASSTVRVLGNLRVDGTASFQHSDNLEITDPFILLNSGSTSDDAFGILGAISATQGIGWNYGGSSDPRFTFTTGSVLASGGTYGTKVGAASLLVNSTSTSENSTYKAQDGNFLIDGSGDIYVYF
tara:strand:- start:3570 stop:4733 length:1164 start_codon:yes stop_codon:yes gene_type:complete